MNIHSRTHRRSTSRLAAPAIVTILLLCWQCMVIPGAALANSGLIPVDPPAVVDDVTATIRSVSAQSTTLVIEPEPELADSVPVQAEPAQAAAVPAPVASKPLVKPRRGVAQKPTHRAFAARADGAHNPQTCSVWTESFPDSLTHVLTFVNVTCHNPDAVQWRDRYDVVSAIFEADYVQMRATHPTERLTCRGLITDSDATGNCQLPPPCYVKDVPGPDPRVAWRSVSCVNTPGSQTLAELVVQYETIDGAHCYNKKRDGLDWPKTYLPVNCYQAGGTTAVELTAQFDATVASTLAGHRNQEQDPNAVWTCSLNSTVTDGVSVVINGVDCDHMVVAGAPVPAPVPVPADPDIPYVTATPFVEAGLCYAVGVAHGPDVEYPATACMAGNERVDGAVNHDELLAAAAPALAAHPECQIMFDPGALAYWKCTAAAGGDGDGQPQLPVGGGNGGAVVPIVPIEPVPTPPIVVVDQSAVDPKAECPFARMAAGCPDAGVSTVAGAGVDAAQGDGQTTAQKPADDAEAPLAAMQVRYVTGALPFTGASLLALITLALALITVGAVTWTCWRGRHAACLPTLPSGREAY